MAFSFGFGGDDIEDENMDVDGGAGMGEHAPSEQVQEGLKPFKLDIQELLSGLPSSVSYRLHNIPSEPSYADSDRASKTSSPSSYTDIRLPRRELHDIRAQIMSTTDLSSPDPVLEAALSSNGDLSPAVYEGGFKTWECANDLAWWMLERSSSITDSIDVCELGAGTAWPSCVVLREMMLRRSNSANSNAGGNVLLLADYNEAVLRMSSFPNIFLTWYRTSQELRRDQIPEMGLGEDVPGDEDGYLEITDDLKAAFLSDLQALRISLVFIAGSWGPDFISIINNELTRSVSSSAGPSGARPLCIMASETIYSPTSLDVFTNTVLQLLAPAPGASNAKSRAVVAAKRIYFGVGGGVDEFKRRLPATADFVEEWEGGQGVGRWMGELQVADATGR